jgi:succinate dehydrogenase cytochrome b subunit
VAKARPFYLDLAQIRLPIGGWVSILHRVSGAVLALAAPVMLYGLMLSLRSPGDFEAVKAFLGGGPGRVILLGLSWATLHHFFAGLRHLGFDLGWGEEKLRSRQTAVLVLVLGVGLTGLVALRVL